MILRDGTTNETLAGRTGGTVAFIVGATGKRVGLDISPRMPAVADLSPDQESGEPRVAASARGERARH